MTTLLLLACLSMALPYTVCGEPVNPFNLLKDRVDCVEKQLGKIVTPEEDFSATNAKLKLQVARVDTLRQENEALEQQQLDGQRVLVARLNATKTELEAEVQELKRDNRVNVALKGVAAQSSLYGIGVASNAIDGTREPEYNKQSCSHTQDDTNPWWRVDLLGVYRVKAINISTMHCCAERLNGAEIHIGNSLENNGINNPRCDVISQIPTGETHTFQCNEMKGRYVVVVIPGRKEYLHLCEVEVHADGLSGLEAKLNSLEHQQLDGQRVWGARLDDTYPNTSLPSTPPSITPPSCKHFKFIHCQMIKRNVALKGVATQSSLYGDGQANNVIDGNRESNYHKISCTHTEQETNPWWRVDRSSRSRVTAVTFTNRGDVVPERLDGAEICIGNSLENTGINNLRCVVIHHIPAGETYTFQCNEMEGQYVVVVIPGQNKILTLCEVEVYGLPAGNHL
ncbi:uncharacterized protein LOC109906205 [Oncorhynchus kisutch]|nr:uncharacterized protein LOC109906205 [Oncorhynchus kisutch]